VTDLMTHPEIQTELDGPTVETLESRRNALEGEMFELAGALSQRLHQVEQQVSELQLALHSLICLSGRTPIETKVPQVVRLVGRTMDGIDRKALVDAGDRVAELKDQVGRIEGAILERIRG
jgi:hypothetical protein